MNIYNLWISLSMSFYGKKKIPRTYIHTAISFIKIFSNNQGKKYTNIYIRAYLCVVKI